MSLISNKSFFNSECLSLHFINIDSYHLDNSVLDRAKIISIGEYHGHGKNPEQLLLASYNEKISNFVLNDILKSGDILLVEQPYNKPVDPELRLKHLDVQMLQNAGIPIEGWDEDLTEFFSEAFSKITSKLNQIRIIMNEKQNEIYTSFLAKKDDPNADITQLIAELKHYGEIEAQDEENLAELEKHLLEGYSNDVVTQSLASRLARKELVIKEKLQKFERVVLLEGKAHYHYKKDKDADPSSRAAIDTFYQFLNKVPSIVFLVNSP